MVHPVLELITERLATGSVPGQRTDSRRLALAIEGGSSRGTYSSGMVLALDELGATPAFDAVYGSSAGALNGAWLLCGRSQTGVRTWWNPTVMRRIINPLHTLRGRAVIDLEYLVHQVYSVLEPMDFPAILANPVSFHPLATDADTGESTDLYPFIDDVDAIKTALAASSCMPVLAGPPIAMGGRRFVDAGVAEPLPFRTALAQGATDVLVLRTRREDEIPVPPPRVQDVVVPRFLRRQAPGTITAWREQYERDLEDERLLREDPRLVSVRPPAGSPDVGALERDPAVLRRAVELGLEAVYAALELLRKAS
ncbi:patatin-like phospholipase family protein [Amycolatopsis saalfeldensis]|uniref:Predicted phospholipase, patatin/cPLA2 family n=1 Tax=Amycolatopsis saalfeldensis TaxID=394193 RepID=A0A1H8YCQ1_9PSEU|nr:patatin family protein [Amycolatopsis saalfeldensis]SEP49939.1 Predicted phospholipase, patatin/cPLA2 family [Amycolatopsis saalfeldensis]